MSKLRTTYLTRLSKPAEDRPIYRAVQKSPISSVVEIGLSRGERALRILEMAAFATPAEQIQYTGVDPFEGRTEIDGPGLTLKKAHRLLSETGAQVRLLPGDPLRTLTHSANTLGEADLVVLATRRAEAWLDQVWYYLPRILAPRGLVFLAQYNGSEIASYQQITSAEVRQQAAEHSGRRAA